jgi:hypothetical protein
MTDCNDSCMHELDNGTTVGRPQINVKTPGQIIQPLSRDQHIRIINQKEIKRKEQLEKENKQREEKFISTLNEKSAKLIQFINCRLIECANKDNEFKSAEIIIRSDYKFLYLLSKFLTDTYKTWNVTYHSYITEITYNTPHFQLFERDCDDNNRLLSYTFTYKNQSTKSECLIL